MTEEIEEDAITMCNIGAVTLLKGEQKKAIETAINLIKMGVGTSEQIAEATGLSLDTVQELAK